MQRLIQRHLSAVVLLALVGLLAGCGGNSSPAASNNTTASTHNAADVAFATGMIPHHAQAIEMAKMAVKNATSKQVVNLANNIQAAQQPEIDTMTGWLQSWGEPAPDTNSGGMGGMEGMGGMDTGDMPGMMSSHEMRHLSMASGAGFDRLWLHMMIQHHQGAIAMAKVELQDGQNTDAKALAQQIITAQQGEITTMNGLSPGRSN